MQKDVANDQELILKKRARRRLVGAISLVLLMIILLPMVLKDRTATEPTEEVLITLSNENKKTDVLPTQSDFDSNVVQADIETNNEELTDSSNLIEQAQPEPTATIEKPNKQPKSEIKKSANAPQYYVQIGVFSDAANVKKLQAKLSDLGYESQTEKIDTAKGEKIRLRTPLLGDRNEAATVLQNIKDAGLTGMVVSQ